MANAYLTRNEPYGQPTSLRDWANNPFILQWWQPIHDEIIRRRVDEWQWYWPWGVVDDIKHATDDAVLAEWRAKDPQCERFAWYNVLTHFAVARFEVLGLQGRVRQAQWKVCPLCMNCFLENSLPMPLVERLGIGTLDYCAPCLRDAVLQGSGNPRATKLAIIEYLRRLSAMLGGVPVQGFGEGKSDLEGFGGADRTHLLQLLQTKPTVKRVKQLFGSWLAALIASGLLEDGTRATARGTQTLAKDGHMCYSLGEKSIDDYLFQRDIEHTREPHYPGSNLRADFEVSGTFIEYFGLEGNPEYDRKSRAKIALATKNGLDLISVYPRDLANRDRLARKLLPLLPASSLARR